MCGAVCRGRRPRRPVLPAEIQWHADRLQTETLGSDDYHSCLKVDLGVETSSLKQQGEYFAFDQYLDGQSKKHGNK